MSILEELTAKLVAKSAASQAKIAREVRAAFNKPFVPSPGPQTKAYLSKADILLYGGQPGGGKTGLLIGLAVNEHESSLIIRKQYSDVEGVIQNAKKMLGSENGFIGGGRPKLKLGANRTVSFEGMPKKGGIDSGKQGVARDFIGIDEGAQFPEAVIRTLIGWNRTTTPGQRCRLVIASNPPVDSTGDWMVEFFAPWLDSRHPNPAKDGELRWFVIGPDDKTREVPGPELIEIDGESYAPHSRTFIRSTLDDNPFLDAADYRRRLQLMPEPMRSILLKGDFMYAREDDDLQVIPTAWIRAAQARWTERPIGGIPMCAMGVDPAAGGADKSVIAARYDGWFDELQVYPGSETPDGRVLAALIYKQRRDNAAIILDMGGGYGMEAFGILKDTLPAVSEYQGPPVFGHKGAEASTARTETKVFGFANKRAEIYWRLREALDPDQEHGSPIALPDDPELLSDLTAVRYEITSRGIQLEKKKDLIERLGRSPDRGDAVAMCWSQGQKAITHAVIWRQGPSKFGRTPQNNTGYANRRRKR